jgi:hypothetical protein
MTFIRSYSTVDIDIGNIVPVTNYQNMEQPIVQTKLACNQLRQMTLSWYVFTLPKLTDLMTRPHILASDLPKATPNSRFPDP